MGITALDLGLRGAAAGLFLMMMVVILARARPLNAIKCSASAMAAAGAAYAIATAPFVPKINAVVDPADHGRQPGSGLALGAGDVRRRFRGSTLAWCLVADRCLHRVLGVS